MGLNIAITGSSSTMAKLLIKQLLEDDSIDEIRGLDINETTEFETDKFHFVQGDVRSRSDLRSLIKDTDLVIHMAFIVFAYPKTSEDRTRIDEINVEGSKNVFEVAASLGIGKIIYLSSVASYGLQFNRNVLKDPLREGDKLTGETRDNFYLTHKKEVELYLDMFQQENQEIIVSRIRPHVLAGPEYLKLVNLKPYKDGLGGSLYTRVKQPEFDGPAVEQLVHEDDVINAVQYCINNDLDGALNVAGDPLHLKKYLQSKSIKLLHVPLGLARFVLWFKALFSDVGRLERYWTNVMVYPVIVANDKYKKLIGDPVSTEEIFDEMYEYLNE